MEVEEVEEVVDSIDFPEIFSKISARHTWLSQLCLIHSRAGGERELSVFTVRYQQPTSPEPEPRHNTTKIRPQFDRSENFANIWSRINPRAGLEGN